MMLVLSIFVISCLCLFDSKMRMIQPLSQPLAKIVSSSSSSPPTSWQSIMSSCKIVYHIHIPKTGGTSVKDALRASFPNYHEIPRSERGDFYTANPINTMKSLKKHVFDSVEYIKFIEQQKHQQNTINTSFGGPDVIPQIITSVEKGIITLKNNHYPDFSNTCFFAVVRNPYEWILSADNHMKTGSGYKGGISGSWGYFNRANIQSTMTGYYQKNIISETATNSSGANILNHTTNSSRADILTSFYDSIHTCMFTIEHMQSVLDYLWKKNVKSDVNGTSATAPILPKSNVKPHNTTVTDNLGEIVQNKYDVDLDMWNEITNEINNGILCL